MNKYNKDYFTGAIGNYGMFFGKFLGGYEQLKSKKLWNKRINTIKKLKSKGRVLDVGCAYGYLLKHLDGPYKKMGIDISEHAISKAKKDGINADFKTINIEKDFSKLKGKFDVITCFEVLEHLQKPRKMLLNFKSKLNKDGFIFISVPSFKPCYLGKWWKKTDHDPTHIHDLTWNEWRQIVKKAGFKIIEDWTSFYDEVIWFKKRFRKCGNFFYITAKPC